MPRLSLLLSLEHHVSSGNATNIKDCRRQVNAGGGRVEVGSEHKIIP
jgi:hypothetical protein